MAHVRDMVFFNGSYFENGNKHVVHPNSLWWWEKSQIVLGGGGGSVYIVYI